LALEFGVADGEWDVILIGAGQNNFALGTYLGKAGLKTVICESRLENGGRLASEEITRPGYWHNTLAYFQDNRESSPVWKELDWADGYHAEFIAPPVISALLLADGGSICQHQSIESTSASIAKFSRRDAEAWRASHSRFHKLIHEYLLPYYYTAPRDSGKLLQDLDAEPVGKDFKRLWQSTPRQVLDELFDFVISPDLVLARHFEFFVEDGMTISYAGFPFFVVVGTAETPGVGQLQPDQQSLLGPGGPAVLFDQRRPQLRQPFLGARSDHELIRVGASFVRDRDRLSTPDQLGAAAPKTLPAPERPLRGLAIERSVPAFHRLHGNPVADLDCAVGERPQERGINARRDLEVARDRQMERIQMLLEVCYILQAAQPQKRICAHADSRLSGSSNTARAPEIVVVGQPPKRDTHGAKQDRKTGPGDLHALAPAR